MIDSGLTNFWVQNIMNPRGVTRKVEEIGPEVLTMDHFGIAFKIMLVAVVISAVGFVSEIVFAYLYKKLQINNSE